MDVLSHPSISKRSSWYNTRASAWLKTGRGMLPLATALATEHPVTGQLDPGMPATRTAPASVQATLLPLASAHVALEDASPKLLFSVVPSGLVLPK